MSKEDRKPLGKAGVTASEAQEKWQRTEEKKIHETVKQWLNLRGIPYVHCRMDKPSTIRNGWPDFTVTYQGRAMCLEIKAAGGVLSTTQKECIAHLERTGTPVKVAYSDGEALEWLRSQIDAIPANEK